jgi:site-specific DNA-cytosine methylase
MKVLVACEYSGVVRDAFLKHGHNAMSCDLLPTESPGPHYQGDVLDLLGEGWDLMIAHPPCTHLSVAGAAWWRQKQADGRQQTAIDFFMRLYDALINKICLENPPGIMTKKLRRPDQYIEPFQFGHEFKKKTGLWLKNLSLLKPTNIVEPKHYWSQPHGSAYKNNTMKLNSCGGHRDQKIRSKSFSGIAEAMAIQWGGLEPLKNV